MNQTAKEFLIDNLNRLSELFSEIHIRYEYRKNTNSHIIEVIPLSVFYKNKDYIKAEIWLEKQFENLFPAEDIIFISGNSLTQIKNAEYEFGNNQMSFDVGILIPNTVDSNINEEFAGETNYALAA